MLKRQQTFWVRVRWALAKMERATLNQMESPKQFVLPQYGEMIVCNNTNYYIGRFINSGSFGSVFECNDEWSNFLVAKVLEPKNMKSYDQIREEWLYELNNLVQLRHPNITYIHDAFEYKDTFYIIVERCDMNLSELMSQNEFQGELWLPYIARDVLHGLEYIHKNGYVHKDIHPGNILVSKHFDLMVPQKDPVWSFKIGDLGISNLEGNIRLFNTILAQWMLPPEYLNPNEFGMVGKTVDIYHSALLFLSLLLNQNITFTNEEILAGKPRIIAESLNFPYAAPISRALRRHASSRTQSALQFWREISNVIPRQ